MSTALTDKTTKRRLAKLAVNPDLLRPRDWQELETITDPVLYQTKLAIENKTPIHLMTLDVKQSLLEIYETYRPKQTKKALTEQFFKQTEKQPIMVMPELATAGAGVFPEAPKNEPKQQKQSIGSITNLIPTKTHVTVKIKDLYVRDWQHRPRDYYFRVCRYVNQCHAEMMDTPLFYKITTSLNEITQFSQTVRTYLYRNPDKKRPYIIFPFFDDDGGMFYTIISSKIKGECKPVPTDRTEAYNLFFDWLNTPEGESTGRHSNGFGMHYQGNKGNSAEKFKKQVKQKIQESGQAGKALQIIHEGEHLTAEKLITKLGFTAAKFKISWGDFNAFAHKLRETSPQMKTRNGGAAWQLLREFKQSMYTGLDNNKDKKTVNQTRIHLGVVGSAKQSNEQGKGARHGD